MFVVVSGALKISEYGEKGTAHILRICRPGHIVVPASVPAAISQTPLETKAAFDGKKFDAGKAVSRSTP